jgi:pleiotropic regulator 1
MAQPGSIDSEMGIFAMTFDQSGSRLITCEADKTIKIYKEDDEAVIFLKYCLSFYIY